MTDAVSKPGTQVFRRECSRCFLTDQYPGLTFRASDGVCSVCQRLMTPDAAQERQLAATVDRPEELQAKAAEIRAYAADHGLKYDCIVGASGGFDSTYALYIAKEVMKLNPLVVKYDNGVCHPQANDNLLEACRRLGVDYRIVPATPYERNYITNATRALSYLGIYFSACFSCHFIIAAVVYREAQRERIHYAITSRNIVEETLSMTSHGFMLKALFAGFLSCDAASMAQSLIFGARAQAELARLKFQFDGFSTKFFRDLLRLHPVAPRGIVKVNVSDYVGWDWRHIEDTLRDKLGWDTPRRMPVPFLRFDCYYAAMIGRSFKRTVGLTGHALLLNWFVQTGYITKEQARKDIEYLNGEEHLNECAAKALNILGLRFDDPAQVVAHS